MCPVERIAGFFMVKIGPAPSGGGVAIGTFLFGRIRAPLALAELASVGVLVAAGTERWRGRKRRRQLCNGAAARADRVMALVAIDADMSSRKRKTRRLVIERQRRSPRGLRVAIFTGCDFLPLPMRIGVAGIAGAGGEPELPGGRTHFREEAGSGIEYFVTGFTRDFFMTALECEPGHSVTFNRERVTVEAGLVVAERTLVGPGRRLELAGVRILVTTGALQQSGLPDGRLSFGFVTGGAGDSLMHGGERKSGGAVGFAVKQRRFERYVVVARGAIGALGPGGELAAVNILMAVAALVVRNRAVEIAVFMTLRTRLRRVSPG